MVEKVHILGRVISWQIILTVFDDRYRLKQVAFKTNLKNIILEYFVFIFTVTPAFSVLPQCSNGP